MNKEEEILIIGNGSSVLDTKYGDIIDSYQNVARINNYETETFKENVGQFSRDSGAGRGGKFTTKASGKYEDQLGKITVLDPKPKKGLMTGGQVEYAPIKNQKVKVSNTKLSVFQRIVR